MARHAQSVHEASAHWEGTLTEGAGQVVGSSSGALKNLPVSWTSRTGGDASQTTPEELLAAAHAACFAMALSYELQGKQTPAESLDVTAAVGFECGLVVLQTRDEGKDRGLVLRKTNAPNGQAT